MTPLPRNFVFSAKHIISVYVVRSSYTNKSHNILEKLQYLSSICFVDGNNREDPETLEAWFMTIREKTRLSRLSKELIVRVQQLQLEERQNQVQEKLEQSLHLSGKNAFKKYNMFN